MKPMVVKTNDNEHILMTLSEFNKIIEQVYNEGFKDGQKDKENSPYIHWDPYIVNYPNYPSNNIWHTSSDSSGTITINDIKNGQSLPKLTTNSKNGLLEIN